MAAATRDAGSLLVLSSNAGTPFAQIGATGATWWLQAYLPADRSLALPLLHRAVQAGAQAVVLTAGTPVVATTHDDGPSIWQETDPGMVRVNFDPGARDLPGFAKATDLGPADITWLREVTGLPVTHRSHAAGRHHPTRRGALPPSARVTRARGSIRWGTGLVRFGGTCCPGRGVVKGWPASVQMCYSPVVGTW